MGFWVSLLISFAFTVIGELLRPKPRIDSPKPTSLGDYRAPTADEARPVPVAYGTVRVTGPNAVWWGDFEARPIRKKVKTGLFSSQRVTLGYQYWLGVQLALSWGTVDELISLEFEDKPVTLRNRVNTPDLVRFDMDEPTLFSADDPKNGLKGAVKFYPGTFTQIANEYLSRQWNELSIPAYRGICYMVFEKCYLSNNDSLPSVAVTVRRTPNTLGLTGGRENINGDANPACMIFEIMTNTFWGTGIPQAAIDAPSFATAANTLHAEGLGLSMLIDTSGSADEIIAEILRHVDGVVFIDPETGKFTMKLARNDYEVASLPEVSPANVLADSFKYTRGSWDETKNTVKVKYIDRSQKYTERVVQQQNLANITARGGQVDADDYDYSGLSNATAANAVAARVLKTVSSPLSRVECEVNRTLFGLRPGSVFRLSWPQLGIAQIVYRITEIDYGTLDSGAMRIRAIEDVFSVAAVSFVNPPTNGWENPFGPTAPVARQSAFEVPYAMLGTMNSDRLIAFTASPSRLSDLGYRLVQSTNGVFTEDDAVPSVFTPNGQLASSLPATSTATSVTLQIINGYALTQVPVPTSAEVSSGGAVARIVSTAGEELVSFGGITVTDTSATLTGVTRGIYDTVPLTHPAGATIWFITEGVGIPQDTAYLSDITVQMRALPFNQRDTLAISSTTAVSVALNSRANRPYPPGGLFINGTYMPAFITGPLIVSWSHRDRVVQGRTPSSQQNGSVGPEAGVTYTLRLYDETGALRRTYTDLTGTSRVWDTEEADCGLLNQPGGTPRLSSRVRIELESVRAGLTSFARHDYTVQRAGAQTGGTTLPGASLAIVGDVPVSGTAGQVLTAPLTAVGVAGVAVWSLGPNSASGASISGIGVLSFTPPAGVSASYAIDVVLTDSSTGNSVTRRYSINVGTGAAQPQSITGTLLNGYVGAPYILLPQFREGLTFSRPDTSNYWTLNRTTGMPDNVTATAGLIFAGTPTTAGTYNWTVSANQWGFGNITHSGTMTVLPSPANTVWNSADRQVTYSTVRFLPGPAPFLQVEGLSVADDGGFGGYVRALNGYTTGKRYWEIRVDSIPTAEGEAVSIGIDRSRYGNWANNFAGNSQYIGADATGGEWGYAMRLIGTLVQSYTAGRSNGQAKAAPALVSGDVIQVYHDADANLAWIGIVGKGWVGGGNPSLGTNPTFSTLPAEPDARWSDYRPLAILRGPNVRITANFGDQPWAGTPPSGATTIPFASQPVFTHQVFDLDTATFDSGTQLGGITVFAPTSITEDVRARGTTVSARALPFIANPDSVRGSMPRSTGKWVVEFLMEGWADRTTVGLAPDNWDTAALPRPGWTADSFGVTRGADPIGNTAGVIRSGNVDVGAIAASQSPIAITLACDFDASPKTVAVRRNGVLVGTYTLPNTGRPWLPVVGVAANGFVTMRSRGIAHAVAGFTPWNPLGTN